MSGNGSIIYKDDEIEKLKVAEKLEGKEKINRLDFPVRRTSKLQYIFIDSTQWGRLIFENYKVVGSFIYEAHFEKYKLELPM